MTPLELIDDLSRIISELGEFQLDALQANPSASPYKKLPALIEVANMNDPSSMAALKMVIFSYRKSFFSALAHTEQFQALLDNFDYRFAGLDDYPQLLGSIRAGAVFDYALRFDDSIKNLLPQHISEHPKLAENVFKNQGLIYLQTLESRHATLLAHWFNADDSFNRNAYLNEAANYLQSMINLHERTISLTGMPIEDPLQDRLFTAAETFQDQLVTAVKALQVHQNKDAFHQTFLTVLQQLEKDMATAYIEETAKQSPYHQYQQFSGWMNGLHSLAEELEKYGETVAKTYLGMVDPDKWQYLHTADNIYARISRDWFNADLSFNLAAYQKDHEEYKLTLTEIFQHETTTTTFPAEWQDNLFLAVELFHTKLMATIEALPIPLQQGKKAFDKTLPVCQNKTAFDKAFIKLRQELITDITIQYFTEDEDLKTKYTDIDQSTPENPLHNAPKDAVVEKQNREAADKRVASPVDIGITAIEESVKDDDSDENNENSVQDDNIVFDYTEEDSDMWKRKSPQGSPSRGSKRQRKM